MKESAVNYINYRQLAAAHRAHARVSGTGQQSFRGQAMPHATRVNLHFFST